jgi:hypothetical protein
MEICEISGSNGGEYEVLRVFWDVAPWFVRFIVRRVVLG